MKDSYDNLAELRNSVSIEDLACQVGGHEVYTDITNDGYGIQLFVDGRLVFDYDGKEDEETSDGLNAIYNEKVKGMSDEDKQKFDDAFYPMFMEQITVGLSMAHEMIWSIVGRLFPSVE